MPSVGHLAHSQTYPSKHIVTVNSYQKEHNFNRLWLVWDVWLPAEVNVHGTPGKVGPFHLGTLVLNTFWTRQHAICGLIGRNYGENMSCDTSLFVYESSLKDVFSIQSLQFNSLNVHIVDKNMQPPRCRVSTSLCQLMGPILPYDTAHHVLEADGIPSDIPPDRMPALPSTWLHVKARKDAGASTVQPFDALWCWHTSSFVWT